MEPQEMLRPARRISKYLRHWGPLSVASSLPSRQSLAPSHTQFLGIHEPLAQVNSLVGWHKRKPKKIKIKNEKKIVHMYQCGIIFRQLS